MMSTQLSQIAKKAKLDRTVRFTSLAHLLTPEFLTETWGMMNRRAASGIDGESTEQFESELKQRVEEICTQLRAGAYRAPPVRRVEIPKGPGYLFRGSNYPEGNPMTILHVDRALTIYGWLGERRRNPNRSNGPESACKIPPWRGWPIPGP